MGIKMEAPREPSAAPLVRMEGIKVQFGNVVALDGVNLRVEPNEVVGLLGDNGAGKTTLIKALLGLFPLRAGQIHYQGEPVRFSSPAEAREAGIETVYQDLALIDHLSIARNFFLGREPEWKLGPLGIFDRHHMANVTRRCLMEMGWTDHRSVSQRAASLSGGERQLLAFGRAFHFCRKLLILDEPTASLSEAQTETVLRMIRQAKERGLAVVFVTHKAHEVFQVADRFVVLHRGRNLTDVRRENTDPKELEKLLVSSRLSAVREMAATVAHQVRNPLGILKVSAEMLRDDFQVAGGEEMRAKYRSLADMLINEVNTLNTVVGNFLDFARPHTPDRQPCDVGQLIDSSVRALPLFRFPRAVLEVEVMPGLPSFLLDRCLMEQVMVNLILNALEASPPEGSVWVRAKTREGRLLLEVEDRGSGMSPETRHQVFNPFFTTKTTGSGLGLSIVHRIIEQHRGEIEVSSRPGEGTTFRILL